MDPKKVFKDNITAHQLVFKKLDNKVFWISWLRVLVFISFTLLVGYLLSEREMVASFVIALVGFIFFGVLVNLHRRLSFERKEKELLVQINQEELQRTEGDLSNFEAGQRFLDDNHNYTSDLDVFGRNSLFQLLNRSFTPTGQSKLAEWLKNPPKGQAILERQKAVTELSGKLEWSQKLQALPRYNMIPKSEEIFEIFQQWLLQPAISKPTRKIVLALIIGSINLAVALYIITSLKIWYIFLPVVLGLFLIRHFQEGIQKAAEVSFKGARLFQSYIYLIQAISVQSFSSGFMIRHQLVLQEPTPALSEIKHFTVLMDALNNRGNLLYWIFNGLFLIDIHLLVRLEQWKAKNAESLNRWIDAISDVEAVNGLAAFANANPDYVMPEISVDSSVFQALQLGHPLIRHTERVCNDFELNKRSKIGIITGSNMSGKSTFLRTVGVNLLLAQIGSPVRAEKLKFTPMGIFTSMRTSDNLEESVSSFYAELKRIESLLQIVGQQQPVFFMLDEILKGTNTKDRHLGAKSLIKQLSSETCMGLVSTHDITLGELSNNVEKITNLHFSSEIVNHELVFDYKLKPGVCHSFNASELMSRIGIKLEK